MRRVDVCCSGRLALPGVVTVAAVCIGGSMLLAARGGSGEPVPPPIHAAFPVQLVPGAPAMTLAALTDAVAEYRDQIDGLRVRYTFVLNEEGVKHEGTLVHAYDGTQSTRWDPRQEIATSAVNLAQHREIGLELSGYADLLCWFGPAVNGEMGEPHPRDLLTILASAQTSLRSDLETIGDRPCDVLDHVTGDGLIRVIWLDQDTPGLPLRQELRNEDGSIVVTRTIDEVVQVAGIDRFPRPARSRSRRGVDRASSPTVGSSESRSTSPPATASRRSHSASRSPTATSRALISSKERARGCGMERRSRSRGSSGDRSGTRLSPRLAQAGRRDAAPSA